MLNVLAYVHLRRIVRSTGAGRVARCLTEHLSKAPGVDLRVLGDSGDYRQIAAEAGPEWTGLRHYLFERDTSAQQARWLFLARPEAETFWPEVQVMFCTAESYVPVKRSRLVVLLNDAAHLEKGVHRGGAALWKQRLKWSYLYRVLERKVDAFQASSQFRGRPVGAFPARDSQAPARGAAWRGAVFLRAAAGGVAGRGGEIGAGEGRLRAVAVRPGPSQECGPGAGCVAGDRARGAGPEADSHEQCERPGVLEPCASDGAVDRDSGACGR